MKSFVVHALFLGLLVVVGETRGQEPPAMPGTTAEHAWLEKFVGQWSTDMKAKMGPDQPAMQCNGTMSSRSIGGFWVINEMKGDMAGEPMTGIQTIGYDTTKKRYVGTWVDSMTSYMWRYEGSVDKTGKVLTLEADGPNFMSEGKLTKFQDIYEVSSEDELKMTSRMQGDDGQWVTFMSGTFKRTK